MRLGYATARVTFRTPRIDDDLYPRLMAIPGCKPWEPYGKRNAWSAPYTAAWLAEAELRRAGVAYTLDVPPVAPLADADALAALAQSIPAEAIALGVHPWVFDNFAMPFQLQCTAFAWDRVRSNVWAEPGSGKTLIAILTALLVARDTQRGPPRILVVTRSSATGQTAGEWERFTRWRVLERRSPSRQRVSDESLDEYLAACTAREAPAVVIVGWDMLTAWADEFIAKMPGAFVVFDESQNARGKKRKVWTVRADGGLDGTDLENITASAAKLARAASGVVGTTATSISNAMIDLWGQMTLIEPDGWGETASRFGVRYCDAHRGDFGMVYSGLSVAYLPEIQARLAWSTIRIPYEVSHAQLPPKRRMMIRVPVEDQVAEVPGKARELRALQKKANAGDEEAAHQSARTELGRAASRKRRAVVQALKDYSTTGKGKVIVFTGWREDCEYLGEQLRRGTDSQVWVSHGGDDKEDREALRKEFMAHPGPCILVGTWQAWGTSMNLDDADVIAFAMLPYTPLEVAQGEGRGDRISMTRPLLYLYFIADGTIDERVVEILSSKMDAVDAVTPGSRLAAFGGISATLSGMDNADAIVSRFVGKLDKADALDEGWGD